MYRMGVDLGGTGIKAGIVEKETGKIVVKGSVPTNAGREPDEIAKDIADLCIKLANDINVDIKDFDYIGVATPGTADHDSGIVVTSNNIPFTMYPLAQKVEEFTGVKKVYIENDANAAAKGEFEFGAARGTKHAVMVTLGTGVGGGIIIDGKVYSGFNYAGAELGHFAIMVDGEPCTCGRHGCWEAYSSATALIRMTKEAMEGKTKEDTVMFELAEKEGKVSGRTSFDAMRMGDKLGKEVVDKYIKYLSVGVINVINIFQPEVLVIGGGLSNEREYILNPLKELVETERYNKVDTRKTEIKIAERGNDAGILGACMLGD